MSKIETKEQALAEIERLKAFIQEADKPKLNKATIKEDANGYVAEMDGKNAITVFKIEQQCDGSEGNKLSGHKASAYVGGRYSSTGYFVDEGGNRVDGYLFWVPAK